MIVFYIPPLRELLCSDSWKFIQISDSPGIFYRNLSNGGILSQYHLYSLWTKYPRFESCFFSYVNKIFTYVGPNISDNRWQRTSTSELWLLSCEWNNSMNCPNRLKCGGTSYNIISKKISSIFWVSGTLWREALLISSGHLSSFPWCVLVLGHPRPNLLHATAAVLLPMDAWQLLFLICGWPGPEQSLGSGDQLSNRINTSSSSRHNSHQVTRVLFLCLMTGISFR